MDTIFHKNEAIADSHNNFLFLLQAAFDMAKRLMHETGKVIKLVQ